MWQQWRLNWLPWFIAFVANVFTTNTQSMYITYLFFDCCDFHCGLNNNVWCYHTVKNKQISEDLFQCGSTSVHHWLYSVEEVLTFLNAKRWTQKKNKQLSTILVFVLAGCIPFYSSSFLFLHRPTWNYQWIWQHIYSIFCVFTFFEWWTLSDWLSNRFKLFQITCH